MWLKARVRPSRSGVGLPSLRVWVRISGRSVHAGQVRLEADGRISDHDARRLWKRVRSQLDALGCQPEERVRLLDALWKRLGARGILVPASGLAPHRRPTKPLNQVLSRRAVRRLAKFKSHRVADDDKRATIGEV